MSRFPDGQLFVNLRGFDPTGSAVEPAEAVRGFLDALRVPTQSIPASLDAQVGMYRGRLAGRRMLILLDNARDEEHVRPLIPASPGSLVLVTSRSQLIGLVAESAHPLTLDMLPPTQARRLLAHRIGEERLAAEPAATAEILARCGGLPLALAIVAARIVTRDGFPLEATASDLRERGNGLDGFDAGDPATDLRAVFSSSYRALSVPAARLFRLLAIHPGPDISTAASASLTGVPLRSARRALNELTRAHLLTEHVPDRFRFHDLIRAHSAELADSTDESTDESTDGTHYTHATGDATATGHANDAGGFGGRHSATIRRMFDHYLHSLNTAAALIAPNLHQATLDPPAPGVVAQRPADDEHAMAWFIAERQVLMAITRYADRSTLDTQAVLLARVLMVFLMLRGHYEDAAEAQHIGLRAARRLGDRIGQARAHRNIAYSYISLGRLGESLLHLERALDISRVLDDPADTANGHLAMYELLHAKGADLDAETGSGHHREALDHARRALELYTAAGHRYGQARALHALGRQHAHLGAHEQAAAACQRAIALMEEIGDRHGQGMALASLGYIWHRLGDNRQAIACYLQALTLFRGTGDRRVEADTLERLGDAHNARGDGDAAGTAWRQALAILDELGHPGADAVHSKLQSGPGVPP